MALRDDGPFRNEKLIATKEQWARDGRHLTGRHGTPGRDRLPPGQHLVRSAPVLDLGHQPAVDTRDWSLNVGGLVSNPLKWDWRDFMAQPQTNIVTDIHCVTSWSRYDNGWTGVAFQHLLAMVRPKAEARFVIIKSFDAYATNLALTDLDRADVLLAHHWDGTPLTRAHGAPVRLVVPHLYFWKSAKWIRHIWFTDRDAPGYWEARGYHGRGDPWKEERYV